MSFSFLFTLIRKNLHYLNNHVFLNYLFVYTFFSLYSVFNEQCCLNHFVILVGSSGLEPPTSCLSGTRSNHLSYEPIRFGTSELSPGGDEGNRTLDPLLAGQVLSQLSYTPIPGSISP